MKKELDKNDERPKISIHSSHEEKISYAKKHFLSKEDHIFNAMIEYKILDIDTLTTNALNALLQSQKTFSDYYEGK